MDAPKHPQTESWVISLRTIIWGRFWGEWCLRILGVECGTTLYTPKSNSSIAPLFSIAATLLAHEPCWANPPLGDLFSLKKEVYHCPVEVTRIPHHFVGRREQFCLPYFKSRFPSYISQKSWLGHINGSSSSSHSQFGK